MAEDNTPKETQPKAVVSSRSGISNPKKLVRVLFGLAVIASIVLIVLMLRHQPTETIQPAFTPAPTASVTITDQGFVPATLLVKKGTIVTWKNTTTDGHSIVSNPHPTHEDLAALKSEPLPKDQVYHYKFNQTGTYNYHDEQSLTSSGTVVVE